MRIDYECLPDHMRDAARLYIERGIEPGSFLTAVLANDLLQAIGRADSINRTFLYKYHSFLVTIPSIAKGSYESVKEWCDEGGLYGREQ